MRQIDKLRRKIRDCRGDHRLEAKVEEISKEIGRIQQLRASDEPMEISRSFNGNILMYRILGRDDVVLED